MTITCEHFIYGYFPNVGYRTVKSPGVTRLLTPTQLEYLQHIGDKATDPTYSQTWWPHSDLLAVSHSHPVRDKYYRLAVWNHTILVKLSDYLTLTQPSRVFEDHFIRDVIDVSTRLTPIQVEAL